MVGLSGGQWRLLGSIWLLLLSGCGGVGSDTGTTSVSIELGYDRSQRTVQQSLSETPSLLALLIADAHAALISSAYPHIGSITLQISSASYDSATINQRFNADRFPLNEQGDALLLSDTSVLLEVPNDQPLSFVIRAFTPDKYQIYRGDATLTTAQMAIAETLSLPLTMLSDVDERLPILATDSDCVDDDGDGLCSDYEDHFFTIEGVPDIDNDGVKNSLDDDSDGDGVSDQAEGIERGRSGYPAFIDADTTTDETTDGDTTTDDTSTDSSRSAAQINEVALARPLLTLPASALGFAEDRQPEEVEWTLFYLVQMRETPFIDQVDPNATVAAITAYIAPGYQTTLDLAADDLNTFDHPTLPSIAEGTLIADQPYQLLVEYLPTGVASTIDAIGTMLVADAQWSPLPFSEQSIGKGKALFSYGTVVRPFAGIDYTAEIVVERYLDDASTLASSSWWMSLDLFIAEAYQQTLLAELQLESGDQTLWMGSDDASLYYMDVLDEQRDGVIGRRYLPYLYNLTLATDTSTPIVLRRQPVASEQSVAFAATLPASGELDGYQTTLITLNATYHRDPEAVTYNFQLLNPVPDAVWSLEVAFGIFDVSSGQLLDYRSVSSDAGEISWNGDVGKLEITHLQLDVTTAATVVIDYALIRYRFGPLSLYLWGATNDGSDSDGDGITNQVELAYGSDPTMVDSDGDTIADGSDNCPLLFNTPQIDSNGNHIGDRCDYAIAASQIPFTSHSSSNSGIAVWNREGASGHPLPATLSTTTEADEYAYYALATADQAYAQFVSGATLITANEPLGGFPELQQLLTMSGYAVTDIGISFGERNLGDDRQGSDWWLEGSTEYRRYQPPTDAAVEPLTLTINGEAVLQFPLTDLTLAIDYTPLLDQSGSVPTISGYSAPLTVDYGYVLLSATPMVEMIGDALRDEIYGSVHPPRLKVESMTPQLQGAYQGSDYDGALLALDRAYLALPSGLVEGRVNSDSGAPLRLQLFDASNTESGALPLATRVADPRGYYQFYGIEPGSYWLRAFVDLNGDAIWSSDEPVAESSTLEIGEAPARQIDLYPSVSGG